MNKRLYNCPHHGKSFDQSFYPNGHEIIQMWAMKPRETRFHKWVFFVVVGCFFWGFFFVVFFFASCANGCNTQFQFLFHLQPVVLGYSFIFRMNKRYVHQPKGNGLLPFWDVPSICHRSFRTSVNIKMSFHRFDPFFYFYFFLFIYLFVCLKRKTNEQPHLLGLH